MLTKAVQIAPDLLEFRVAMSIPLPVMEAERGGLPCMSPDVVTLSSWRGVDGMRGRESRGATSSVGSDSVPVTSVFGRPGVGTSGFAKLPRRTVVYGITTIGGAE
jgi:hypothetical protein